MSAVAVPKYEALDMLRVPQHVLADLLIAEREVPAGWEIGGRLLVDAAGRVHAFEQTANLADQPGLFNGEPFAAGAPVGLIGVPVHSHPEGDGRPSCGDLYFQLWHGSRLFAVYAAEDHRLVAWRIVRRYLARELAEQPTAAVDPGDVVAVPVVVDARRERPVLRRPGRR